MTKQKLLKFLPNLIFAIVMISLLLFAITEEVVFVYIELVCLAVALCEFAIRKIMERRKKGIQNK